jgi:hypothetical protein
MQTTQQRGKPASLQSKHKDMMTATRVASKLGSFPTSEFNLKKKKQIQFLPIKLPLDDFFPMSLPLTLSSFRYVAEHANRTTNTSDCRH